jgi:hypothetical protein
MVKVHNFPFSEMGFCEDTKSKNFITTFWEKFDDEWENFAFDFNEP